MDLFKPDLARMERKGNFRGLTKPLHHWDPMVRALAADALVRAGSKGAVALCDSLEFATTRYFVSVGCWSGAVALCDSLEFGTTHGEVRRRVIETLKRIGEPAVEPLCVALGHKQSRVREGAASALGRIGEARAVARLRAALNDSEPGVRREVRLALNLIGTPEAMDALAERTVQTPATERVEPAPSPKSRSTQALEGATGGASAGVSCGVPLTFALGVILLGWALYDLYDHGRHTESREGAGLILLFVGVAVVALLVVGVVVGIVVGAISGALLSIPGHRRSDKGAAALQTPKPRRKSAIESALRGLTFGCLSGLIVGAIRAWTTGCPPPDPVFFFNAAFWAFLGGVLGAIYGAVTGQGE